MKIDEQWENCTLSAIQSKGRTGGGKRDDTCDHDVSRRSLRENPSYLVRVKAESSRDDNNNNMDELMAAAKPQKLPIQQYTQTYARLNGASREGLPSFVSSIPETALSAMRRTHSCIRFA